MRFTRVATIARVGAVVALFFVLSLNGCGSEKNWRWAWAYEGTASNVLGCGSNVHAHPFVGTFVTVEERSANSLIVAADDSNELSFLLLVLKPNGASGSYIQNVFTADGTLQAFLVRYDKLASKVPNEWPFHRACLEIAHGQKKTDEAFAMVGSAQITKWRADDTRVIQELDVDLHTGTLMPVHQDYLMSGRQLLGTGAEGTDATYFRQQPPVERAVIKGRFRGFWKSVTPLP